MMSSEFEERGGNRECLKEFIDVYRKEPCLWRVKSKHYHDRNMKDAAYERLIEKYKIIDPNANREVVVKKINNLRTSYRKELKKVNDSKKSAIGKDEVYSPKLWYFHLLDFLHDHETPRLPVTNLSGNENEDEVAADPSDGHAPLNPSSPQDLEISVEHPPAARPSCSRPVKKSSSNLTENALYSVNNNLKRPRYEDRFEVYGKHVGMKLRELAREQRILAEKLINDALFLGEMGHLTTSHSVRDQFESTFHVQPWQEQMLSQSCNTDESAASFVSHCSDDV